MHDEFNLAIPATQQMLLVARMALSGFCCQYGADVDTIDDIRMLSDEACYCLMHQPELASGLRINAWADGSIVHIRFEAEHGAGENIKKDTPDDAEIVRGILSTLASHVRLAVEQDATCAIEVEVSLAT